MIWKCIGLCYSQGNEGSFPYVIALVCFIIATAPHPVSIPLQFRKSLLIVLLFITAIATCSATKLPTHTFLTTEDGMPSNTTYDLLQDRQGYMWFATGAGVSRYDGRKFTNYSIKDGLIELDILKLFEDSQGRIWFLSLNGYVCYWQNGKIYNEDEIQFLKELKMGGSIMSMAEDREGTVWIGSTDQHCSSLSKENMVTNYYLPNAHVELFCNQNGELFLLNEHVRYFWGNNQFQVLDSINTCSYHMFRCSNEALNKTYALACEGLFSFSGKENPVLEIPIENIPIDIKRTGIFTVDNHGNFSVPLPTGGMSLHWKTDTGFEPSQIELPDIYINRNYIDDENNMWVSTVGNGVIFFSAEALQGSVLTAEFPELQGTIGCLKLLSDGSLAVGMVDGSLHKMQHNKLTTIAEKNLRFGSNILHIAECGDSLFFCNNMETYCWHNNRITGIKSQNALRLNEYGFSGQKCVLTDRNGQLYATSFGIRKFNNSSKTLDTFWPESIVHNRICAPFFDHENNLWFENGSNLFLFNQNGELKNFPDLQQHFRGKITCIREVEKGILLICTYGNGLQLIRDGKVVHSFNTGNGLASDVCRMAYLQNDTLLVATSGGLSVLRYRDSALSLIKNLTTTNGLTTDDVRTAVIYDNHYVVGTVNGLFTYPINSTLPKAQPPRVYLAEAKNFNNQLFATEHFSLSSNEANLILKFDIISFNESAGITYRFRLKSTEEWTETQTPEFSFTKLQPGSYQFQLSAKKINSEWSNPFTLSFSVALPWYKQPINVLLGLALLSVVLIISIARFFRLQSAKAIMESKRAEDLVNERLRIAADVHDDLGADLSNLLMESRIASGQPNVTKEERRQIERMENTASALLEKVDEIIWSIDPKEDNLDDFISYLHKYFEEFLTSASLSGSFHHQTNTPGIALSSNVRRQLYLCVKEVLNNISKHAKASHVLFEFNLDDNNLVIDIRDNGVGISESTGETKHRGHGLQNLKDRMRTVEGKVLVNTDHQGTSVKIQILKKSLSPK